MKNTILLAACLLLLSFFTAGCEPEPSTATRVLEDEGFANIELTGWQPFSCSDSDAMNTGFNASRTMPDGTTRNVSGVVCCGWLKSCTVRH